MIDPNDVSTLLEAIGLAHQARGRLLKVRANLASILAYRGAFDEARDLYREILEARTAGGVRGLPARKLRGAATFAGRRHRHPTGAAAVGRAWN